MKQHHWVWLVWLIWFNSLDLPQLTTFTTGYQSFYKTTSLSLTSLIDLIQFIRSSSIDNIHSRIEFILVNNIIEFDQCDWFDSTHVIFLNWQHSLQERIHSLQQPPSPSPVRSLSHSHQMFLSLTANTQSLHTPTTHSVTSPPPPSPPIPVLLLPPHHLASQPLKSAILTAHGKSWIPPPTPVRLLFLRLNYFPYLLHLPLLLPHLTPQFTKRVKNVHLLLAFVSISHPSPISQRRP